MFRSTASHNPLVAILATAILGLSTVPAHAGGQMMTFDDPADSKDANLKKAVLLVSALDCGRQTNAKIRGAAEGVVDGKRRSIPLKLVSTGRTGEYAVFKQWPGEGTWALTFEYSGLYALVDLSKAGAKPGEARPAKFESDYAKPSPFGEVLLFHDRIPAGALSSALAVDVLP